MGCDHKEIVLLFGGGAQAKIVEQSQRADDLRKRGAQLMADQPLKGPYGILIDDAGRDIAQTNQVALVCAQVHIKDLGLEPKLLGGRAGRPDQQA